MHKMHNASTRSFVFVLFVSILVGCVSAGDTSPDAQPASPPCASPHSLTFAPGGAVSLDADCVASASAPVAGYVVMDTSGGDICVRVNLTARATAAGIRSWDVGNGIPTLIKFASIDFGVVEETREIATTIPESDRGVLLEVALNPGWDIDAIPVVTPGACE
jgi:hypothetical protein